MKNKNDHSPSWLTLNQRALNGNILITGSIGGGKTQGTILPYFDQILANFAPSPAVLAIDPKGTFVPEAMSMIGRRELLDRVIHFSLDGKTTFNPIFHPDCLRGSRFLDIAYMIRAAATNYMGKSIDSAFWEISSFNLIKNALVYCAAVHGYYTLNILYDVMLRSGSDEISQGLQEAMDTGSFDDEQKFNIAKALSYFAMEYRQLDEKVRTGILATATSFLNQFQEYRASRIFCPPEEERTLKCIDEAVDQRKIILFDIKSPALARSMGTIMKLLYQQSLLDRLKCPERGKEHCGVLLIDEYQDVVTTGHGAAIGDDRFLAKGREANTISIVATQSLSSLENSIGREAAMKELCQNFRTRIAGHSTDLATIRAFQELVGQEEREKVSHSFSELSQDAKSNFILGGFEAENANISESVSTSSQREFVLTGKEFSSLKTFECFAIVFDGVGSNFHRLFLKPYFLADRRTSHQKVLARLVAAVIAAVTIGIFVVADKGMASPNLCSIVKAPAFSSCMDMKVGACTCGMPPRPCALLSYYVPTTFVEVMPHPGESFFDDLPGVKVQLGALDVRRIPFGAEADGDTHSFQAHVLPVPLSSVAMSTLACPVQPRELSCFEAMSEHLGSNWTTGAGDLLQPSFLAWGANPKACLLTGAAKSVAGGERGPTLPGTGKCSSPLLGFKQFPPSLHAACTGWGPFFPRTGTASGPSQTVGALLVAARIKSLASEVFLATPSHGEEKWQMISPQPSSCFREGENAALLETTRGVNEVGRLTGASVRGYLFTVWSQVTCCRDVSSVPTSAAVVSSLKAACQGG